jgi:hypothetical protein
VSVQIGDLSRARSPAWATPLESLLEAIAHTLDVSQTAYDQATERYKAVGRWLCADDSILCPFEPEIYPQGSFLLGTVVKPLSGDDYDIDAVVQLRGSPGQWIPAQLKSAVAARLRENGDYRRMLQPEGRRCWTLRYAPTGANNFHMDLLPSVSIVDPANSDSLGTSLPPPTAIAITNRVSPQHFEWRESDPKGYAEWFRVRTQMHRRGPRVIVAGIQSVPELSVRSPLQHAVLLLKRYRDVLFENDEHAPISVIITTLAAHAYGGEETLEEALLAILARMPNGVENRAGGLFIPNPVRPNENFADRWHGDVRKQRAFLRWLDATKSLREELESTPPEQLLPRLDRLLGESSARTAMLKYAQLRDGSPTSAVLRTNIAPAPPTLPRAGAGILAGLLGLLNELYAKARHRQAPRWPMHADGSTVRITARAVDNRGVGLRAMASGDTVAIGTELRFEAHPDTAGGELFWQVTNTGTEAQEAKDLRGRFESGRSSRIETAKYRGEHFVECFVVRNGSCVARSGPFAVIIR